MAQSSDMSLGSGGFAAGYTPITFAPLMSLTGPVMAQAPAAPTAEAPMAPAPIRYPTMADMPDNAYMTGGMPTYGGASIGNRSGAEIRGDLARIAEFFTSPLSTMASYAATGKMPSEHMQALTGSAGGNPFAGFLQGLQGLIGGGQQAAEVPLGPQMLSEKAQGGVASIGGIGGAAYNDAVSIALGGGASQEMADAAGRNAAGLVAQGMDPAAAVALASMTATGQVGPEMPGGMPAPGGQTQGLPGLSRNAFDLTAPVAPRAAQTFGIQTGGGYAPSDFGGYGGGVAGETGAPGESSFGLDR